MDGALAPAIGISDRSFGTKTIYNHPKTKVPFDGFKLPMWSQTCQVIREAAVNFLPIRTIGWDVALTPNGPVILEANPWWGAVNEHRRMPEILKALRDQAGNV